MQEQLDPLFEKAIRQVIYDEGPETNDPNDAGGNTKYGRDQRSWPYIVAKLPNNVRATMPSKVHFLTYEQATQSYYEFEWKLFNCSNLPPALAVLVFNAAINPGPSWVAKALQQAVGTVPDGIIGPATISAAHNIDIKDAVIDFTLLRQQYYLGLRQFTDYGKGWERRCARDLLDIAQYIK